MGYISVRNWRSFQHYDPQVRQPPWIKNVTSLMSNDDYLKLSTSARGVLHGIWMEYARSRCELPEDTLTLSRRLSCKVLKSHLTSLVDAGFITIVASKALAEGYQTASTHARPRAREKLEVEVETPLPPLQGTNGKVKVTGWRYVRGSHSHTYVKDPAGTDTPPKGYA